MSVQYGTKEVQHLATDFMACTQMDINDNPHSQGMHAAIQR